MGTDKLQASPIKALRLQLSLNQRDFSRLIGKSQAFLSDLESASVKMPTDVVARLIELGAKGEEIRQEHEAVMERRLLELQKDVIEKLKSGQR